MPTAQRRREAGELLPLTAPWRVRARVMTAASRASDLMGRLGGDEFMLMLGEDVAVAEQRLAEALAEHNASFGEPFELRLSVGAERWAAAEDGSLDELVCRADAVMYADKSIRPARTEGVVRVSPARKGARVTKVLS